jgi:NAD(P)-dependent dehydrogenase (short-subunit alcohol dehydrogenase family)
MQSSLKGKVVLVTGGGRGLGHAIAAMFAGQGAVGVVADLPSSTRLAPPHGMLALDCDVSSEPSVAACVAATLEQFGQIDVVIANAGLVPGWRTTENLDFDEWDRVMAVNARGVAITLSKTAKALSATKGSVVVMASINSFAAHGRQMLYTASKHAVLGIVRAAARDLGPQGVRVNALARIQHRASTGGTQADAALQELARGNAMRRLATAAEVAQAALFLASDLASGITGVLLPVDAGLQ